MDMLLTQADIDGLNADVSQGNDVETVALNAALTELTRVNYERETCDTAILYRDSYGRRVTGWITRNTDGTPRGEDGFSTEMHPFEDYLAAE